MDRTQKAKQAREQHRKQLIESKHKERTYGPPKVRRARLQRAGGAEDMQYGRGDACRESGIRNL